MTERHTSQQSERWLLQIKGSRAPVPEKTRPEPDHQWAYRPDHDYTYGLSKPALRPVGPFPLDEYGQAHKIERTRNPSARTRRKRSTNRALPRSTPPAEVIVKREYIIAEPVVLGEPIRRRKRYVVSQPAVVPPKPVFDPVRQAEVNAELEAFLETGIDWQ